MSRLLSLLLFTFLCLSSFSQDLTVRSFQEKPSDLSARTSPRKDLNGNDCALIKVQLPIQGATFSGLVVGNPEYRVNEYWVYVADGGKHLNINVPDYHTVNVTFSDFGISSVKKSNTYSLVIDIDKQKTAQQDVMISFTPVDATVVVDGEVQDDSDGKVTLSLPVGKHNYSVVRKGYYIQSGDFDVKPSTPVMLTAILQRNPNIKSNVAINSGNIYIIDNKSYIPNIYGDYENEGYHFYENDGHARISDFIDVSDCNEAVLQCNENNINIGIVTYNSDKCCIRKMKSGQSTNGQIITEPLDGVSYIKLIFWDNVVDLGKISWSVKLKGKDVKYRNQVFDIPGHIQFDDSQYILDKQSDIRFYHKNCCSNQDVTFDLVDDNNVFTSELIDVSGYNYAEFHINNNRISMQITMFDHNKHIVEHSTTYPPSVADLRKAAYIRLTFYIWTGKLEYIATHPNTLSWEVKLKR